MTWRATILTLFPEVFPGVLGPLPVLPLRVSGARKHWTFVHLRAISTPLWTIPLTGAAQGW